MYLEIVWFDYQIFNVHLSIYFLLVVYDKLLKTKR
jgi:hypothetical protein